MRVDNNIIKNSGFEPPTGIRLDGATIEENAVVDITRNLIDNNGNGIYARDTVIFGSMNILFNEIVDRNANPDNRIYITPPAVCAMVRYNNIENHNQYGAYYSGPENLNAFYNWWGSNNGPGADGANDVSSDVLYNPWLTERTDRHDLIRWSGAKFSDGQGQSFTSEDGKIETSFDSKNDGRILTEQMKKVAGAPVPEELESGIFFDISAKPVNSVENVWITIHYSDGDVEGIEEEEMKIYYWNSETTSWDSLKGIIVEAQNNTISGYVSHLSPFALLGPELEPLEPASFEVSELLIDPDKVEPGEKVDISAKVKNTGELEGTYTAELSIEGESVDSKTVTLGGGKSTHVSFQVSRVDPGVYDVDIDDQEGNFEVLEPAEFEVSNLYIEPSSPVPGEEVTISCTVKNIGGIRGDYLVTLREKGGVIGTNPVSLGPGGGRTVTFRMKNLTPGKTYKISVDGLKGEFTVGREDVGRGAFLPEDRREIPTASMLWFIIFIALSAFILIII